MSVNYPQSYPQKRWTEGSPDALTAQLKYETPRKACGAIRRGVEEQDNYFASACLKTRLARSFITSTQSARVVKMPLKSYPHNPITHCDGNLITASIPQQSNP